MSLPLRDGSVIVHALETAQNSTRYTLKAAVDKYFQQLRNEIDLQQLRNEIDLLARASDPSSKKSAVEYKDDLIGRVRGFDNMRTKLHGELIDAVAAYDRDTKEIATWVAAADAGGRIAKAAR